MNLICDICQKKYASYKTLWYHKKTKHNIQLTDNTNNVNQNSVNQNSVNQAKDVIVNKAKDVIVNQKNINQKNVNHAKDVIVNKATDVNINQKNINQNNVNKTKDIVVNHAKNNDIIVNEKDIEYSCEYCLKTYKTRQSKSRHKKTCNIKKRGVTNVQEINDLINDLQIKITNLEKNNGIKNIININNGTINNQTNNKIIINKIGEENPFELKLNQIQKVLSQELISIITLIEYLNFNEQLPSNHNFLTSSLESNYLTIYNSDENTFEKQRKKYVFDEVMESSISKVEKLYNVFRNDFPPERQYEIKNNIDALKQIHQAGYSNKLLKELNKQLNLLSYNKKHIVEKTWSRLRNDPIDDDEDKKYWLELATDNHNNNIATDNHNNNIATDNHNNNIATDNHNNNIATDNYNIATDNYNIATDNYNIATDNHNIEPEFKFITNDDSDNE